MAEVQSSSTPLASPPNLKSYVILYRKLFFHKSYALVRLGFLTCSKKVSKPLRSLQRYTNICVIALNWCKTCRKKYLRESVRLIVPRNAKKKKAHFPSVLKERLQNERIFKLKMWKKNSSEVWNVVIPGGLSCNIVY